MMYTRERLMKAVRDAGRGGRPFTLGEVRGELGFKSLDKRELKRFRSRFRECSQILGDNLEKLGPNTFRLKAGFAEPLHMASALPVKGAPQLSAKKQPAKVAAQPEAAVQASSLLDRVGVPARVGVGVDEEEDLYTTKRRPREHIEFVAAQPSASGVSFGERISSWFGRPRHSDHAGHQDASTASTALSRLAVELQPKATGFEYRWIKGKLQVQRAGEK